VFDEKEGQKEEKNLGVENGSVEFWTLTKRWVKRSEKVLEQKKVRPKLQNGR